MTIGEGELYDYSDKTGQVKRDHCMHKHDFGGPVSCLFEMHSRGDYRSIRSLCYDESTRDSSFCWESGIEYFDGTLLHIKSTSHSNKDYSTLNLSIVNKALQLRKLPQEMPIYCFFGYCFYSSQHLEEPC